MKQRKRENRKLPSGGEVSSLLDSFRLAAHRNYQRIIEYYFPSPTKRQAMEKTQVPKSIWWGYYPVALVALIGILITIAAFFQNLSWEKNEVKIAFREASEDRLLVIQRELKQTLAIVQDIASFFEASDDVGRREFRKFVGPALKRQAGIKALEWVPVVLAAERKGFVEEAQRSFPPFRITEIDPLGKLIDGPERAVYYPVLYVQPYQTNKETLGLNMGTNPIVSTLLADAARLEILQVSPGISFVHEGTEKSAMVVAVPVFSGNDAAYDNPPPTTPECRLSGQSQRARESE